MSTLESNAPSNSGYQVWEPLATYLVGPSNPVTGALSQDSSLTWVELMSTLESNFPPGSGYQVWEHLPEFAKAVLTALVWKCQDP